MFRCLIHNSLRLVLALALCAGAGTKTAWQQFVQCRTVTCQAVDDSIVWIGTDDCGLARLSPPSGQMSFLTNLNSGLPSNSVNCLAIGRDHALWIGTDAGLASFDGRTWRVFTAANAPFMSNSVSAVALDSSGGLWVGFSAGGISILSSSGWTNLLESRPGFPLSLACNPVSTIAPVSGHDAWISWDVFFEDSYWFAFLNNDGWHAYGNNRFLGNRCMASDPAGAVWLQSYDYSGNTYVYGLTRLTYPDSLKTFTFPASSPSGSLYLTNLAIDAAGRKWAGVGMKNSLVCLSDTTWAWTPPIQDTAVAKGSVSSIVFDKVGSVWAGFNRTNLDPLAAHLSGSVWTLYPLHGSEIPFNDVRFISPSKDGAAWVGGQNPGRLVWFESGVGKAVAFVDSILGNSYYSTAMCSDGSGGIWIGKASGLMHGSGQQWKVFELPASFSFNANVLHMDKRGILWAGMSPRSSRNYAVAAYDTVGRLIEIDSSQTVPLIGIASAPDGTVWGATAYAGLLRRTAKGSWTQVTKANSSLASDSITGILSGPDGRLWVGTKDRGLACLSNGQWTSQDTLNSKIPGQSTMPLCLDTSGNLWLVAEPLVYTCRSAMSYRPSTPVAYCYSLPVPNGLVKFDGTRWTVYNTINSGLPSNTVYTAAAGDNGSIWVGTDKGLGIFNAASDPVDHTTKFHAAAGDPVRIRVGSGMVTIQARSCKILSILLLNAAGRTVPVLQNVSAKGTLSTLSLSRLSPGYYCARIGMLSAEGRPVDMQRHFVVPGG
jgi:ligand-binding sensor domain-containing protein